MVERSPEILVADAICELEEDGRPVTFAAVAAATGIERTRLYRDPDLRDLIDPARGVRRPKDQRRTVEERAFPAPRRLVEAIATACVDVAREGGAPTLAAVARRAGVSRQTVYRHVELRAIVQSYLVVEAIPA